MALGSAEQRKQEKRMAALLAQVPLFNELSAEALQPIVAGTTEIKVARDEVIFQRGDPCVGFHVVMYGLVKLLFVSSSGAERVVRLIGPGDGFGEALMFMGKDYIVTAVALRDSLLLHVGRDALFEQLDRDPRIARRMLAGLSSRLYNLMADVEAYTLKSAPQRLVSWLLKESRGAVGEAFRIEIGKAVMASRLNLSPEHFSRLLRDMSDKGLLRVRGREYTIIDPQGLRDYRG